MVTLLTLDLAAVSHLAKDLLTLDSEEVVLDKYKTNLSSNNLVAVLSFYRIKEVRESKIKTQIRDILLKLPAPPLISPVPLVPQVLKLLPCRHPDLVRSTRIQIKECEVV